MNYEHLLIFGSVMATAWFLFIYFWPRMLLSVYKRALLVKGFGDGPIPANTLYTQPQKLFAEPLTSQTASSSNLMTVGVNHDTLATCGWLDLRKGPLVLHVPGMHDRYYSVHSEDDRFSRSTAESSRQMLPPPMSSCASSSVRHGLSTAHRC